MKRALITLIAAGGLAIPTGLAMAQDDTVEPAEPTPTCQEHQRAGEQFQDHGRARFGDGTCDGECDGDHAHHREQARLADDTGAGDQLRNRDQTRLQDDTCDGDCDNDQLRNRDQTTNEDAPGPGPGRANG